MSLDLLSAAAAAGAIATPELLSGVVVEVHDLASTRHFYAPIFDASGGHWVDAPRNLVYQRGAQRVEFVQRARPRTSGDTGQHQAYVVPAMRLPEIADGLTASGHVVHWWHEDHPAERAVTAYVHDPSGNQVQLVCADATQLLLHHASLEIHDLEMAEVFYVKVLGGSVDYCHGWAMNDYVEAKAWGEGRDPCAPWTRRFDVRYWDKVRIARPNMQLFVRYGASTLGLMLATEHRQEPPPEILRGTPRVIVQTQQPLTELATHLCVLHVPFEAEGSALFLRDPGGNYLQLDCRG
jgi:extradiol dioxygenase family protein